MRSSRSGYGKTTRGERAVGGEEIGGKDAAGEAGEMFVEKGVGEVRAEDDVVVAIDEHDGAVEGLLELLFGLDAHLEFVGERALEGADLEMGGDAGEDFGRVDGFGDVVDGAAVEGADFFLGLVAGGHDEHGDVAPLGVFFQAVAGGEAIQLGHDEIEENKIGLIVLEELEGAAAVFGDEEFVACLGERIEHERDVGRGVVDDEDFGGTHEREAALRMRASWARMRSIW